MAVRNIELAPADATQIEQAKQLVDVCESVTFEAEQTAAALAADLSTRTAAKAAAIEALSVAERRFDEHPHEVNASKVTEARNAVSNCDLLLAKARERHDASSNAVGTATAARARARVELSAAEFAHEASAEVFRARTRDHALAFLACFEGLRAHALALDLEYARSVNAAAAHSRISSHKSPLQERILLTSIIEELEARGLRFDDYQLQLLGYSVHNANDGAKNNRWIGPHPWAILELVGQLLDRQQAPTADLEQARTCVQNAREWRARSEIVQRHAAAAKVAEEARSAEGKLPPFVPTPRPDPPPTPEWTEGMGLPERIRRRLRRAI